MSGSDFFWIAFMILTLQPYFSRKLLENSRRGMIQLLEQQRKSRVIILIHRQEIMSLLGFPFIKFITVEDAEEVMRAIQMTDPEMPLDIIIHTPGGLVLPSLQIARALHNHKGRVTVFVPHYAMSGGTLIALAADEIVMCHHSVLGPVDPQIGQLPAASILKAVEQKPIAEIEDTTLILADQARKAIKQLRDNVAELVSDKMSSDKADELSHVMADGKWTHDFAITPQMANELGLPIKTEMPLEVLKLMNLYPQPTKRQPTVEYLPFPRKTDKPT